ncbi:hypothetical protein Poli38472_001309 [Pythium oligandrum]|uniref:Uncharacterized protein n=1 Tax=Pythium oligandrum TaxID=41045 RepID=A0A8K1CUE7_PYTOL|nr:hypothetical protein Poli38472_001309 [Pythium oligandrum]|eukprot:TMW69153.1 hypothetical protein Poli38472_001309 [Pythium oligandrum]
MEVRDSDGLAGATERLDTLTMASEEQETLSRQECTMRATQSAQSGDYTTAIEWCSRALAVLGDSNEEKTRHAASVLYQRRSEYHMAVKDYQAALEDVDRALKLNDSDRRQTTKAYKAKCRAFLGLDRRDDALSTWTSHFGLDSSVLDTMAFERTFGLTNETDAEDHRYDTAIEYLYRRDYGNAVGVINKEMDRHNMVRKDPVWLLLRARCRLALQEFEQAAQDTERLIALFPTATEAYRWLCEAQIAQNQHNRAWKVCQAGLVVAPSNEKLLAIQKQLQARRAKKTKQKTPVNETEDVVEETDTVEEADEEAEDPRIVAIRALKKAIKAKPKDSSLYVSRARLRMELKQYESAQTDSEAAVKLNPDNVDGYISLCEALYALRKYPKGAKVSEEGLRRHPEDAFLQEWREKMEDAILEPPPFETDESDELPQQTRSRVPKVVAARRKERAERLVAEAEGLRIRCYDKAVDLADSRDFGNAVFWVNKAMGYAGKSEFAEYYTLRARCRFELKQFELVQTDCERAIALDPENPENYRWLSQTHKTLGRMDAALRVCEAGLKLSSDHKPLLSLQKILTQRNRQHKK